MQNILQCATDRAVTMVEKHQGYIALMKRKISGLIAIYCVIHRQHLVARNLSAELQNSLHIYDKTHQQNKSSFS